VNYCIRKDAHYSTCVDLRPGDDERREPRLGIRRGGRITTLAGGQEAAGAEGVLVDLAVSGMRLRIPYEAAPGDMILVEMESDLVAGEVRRCARTSAGDYEAGVAITDVLSTLGSGALHRGVLQKAEARMAHAVPGKGMQQPASSL
jgi:hypothetical protein